MQALTCDPRHNMGLVRGTEAGRLLTEQPGTAVGPGAEELQHAATTKAVANGKELVRLDNRERPHLHSIP